ncbi:signal peptidase I [Microbacterium sp.]|uniref:signal peptidase I n=1 Tax=Microbacterium sp. TaxID=51671 RepID=UPI002811F7B1|nr:signal peptidase I [Microbacterium sp.]
MAAADAVTATPTPRVSRVRETLRSITKGVSIGVLVLVLGLGVLVIGVPAAVGGVPLTILTGSMRPSLPPGTLVIVKPTPAEEIAIGDVLTYQLESGKAALVTHRVIGRAADSASGELRFVTQGDANDTADAEPVRPVQIRGTVWYAVPWIGWANQAISGQARAWLVPLAAGGLFVYAGWLLTAGVVERARSKRAA